MRKQDVLAGAWESGVHVHMKFLDAEERRSEWINGGVKAIDPLNLAHARGTRCIHICS